jgi:hypothetical protein
MVMAKVEIYTFGSNDWNGDASISKAFFDSLNCPILQTMTLNDYDFIIQFDNSITLKSYGYGSPGAHIAIIDHDNEIKIGDFHGAYGSKTYTVIYNDNVFYLRYKGITYGYEGFDFFFEKIGDHKIYGIAWGTGVNITNMIFNDYVTRMRYQRDIPLLTYSTPTNTLDYLNYDSLFTFHRGDNSNPVKKILDDPNCLATTMVTPRKKITFGGKYYYSLGPNTLIPLDT